MSEARPSLADDPAVRRLAQEIFRHQKEERLWAAECCNLVGVNVLRAPAKCSVCGKPPAVIQELRPADVLM